MEFFLSELGEQEQCFLSSYMDDWQLDSKIVSNGFDFQTEDLQTSEIQNVSSSNPDESEATSQPEVSVEELYSLQLYDFGDTNWSVQNNLTSKDSIGHQIVSEAASDSTVNLFMDNRETNIDGSILTNEQLRKENKTTTDKNFSRKSSTQSSNRSKQSTVGPAQLNLGSSFSDASTISFRERCNSHSTAMQENKQIYILSEPRESFRPRTENECKSVSHFIRCKDGAPFEYPTIVINRQWNIPGITNFIVVTLVDIQNDRHFYTIRNKTCHPDLSLTSPISCRGNNQELFFLITNEDFDRETKSFQIEFVKSKQSDTITKRLIADLSLEQSKLCFTRWYYHDGTLIEDHQTKTYSVVMKELYSEVSVERMNPTYGPFFGDEVCLFTKGRFLVDDIIIQVAHNEQTVPIQEFNKYVNYIIFRMPQMQATGHINTKVQVNVYYKNNLISTMPYVYSSSIDEIFASMNLNDQIDHNATLDIKPQTSKLSGAVRDGYQKKVRRPKTLRRSQPYNSNSLDSSF